jgi:putative transposase
LGLAQIVIYLLGRKRIFLDVLPITVIAEDFKKVMQVLMEGLDSEGLKLVMVFADRGFAVNEVVSLGYGFCHGC